MPKPKKQPALTAPLPGYLTLQRQRLRRTSGTPVATAPAKIPSTARWRFLLDKSSAVMQMLADEMQAYSDTRQPEWYDTPGATLYMECMDDLYHIHGLLDDLRSNF